MAHRGRYLDPGAHLMLEGQREHPRIIAHQGPENFFPEQTTLGIKGFLYIAELADFQIFLFR